MRHIKEPTRPVTLSVEEEAILLDEHNEQAIAVDNTAEETQRMGDIIVSLGDAQAVVSNTPEIGSAEESLVTAVAEMAVAGTDADPEEVAEGMLPPAEGLSAEGLADNLKSALLKIWEAIKAGVVKMWEHVVGFFRQVTQLLGGTKRRIKRLEDVIHQAPNIKESVKNGMGSFKGPADVLMRKNDYVGNGLGRAYKEASEWMLNVVDAAVAQGKLAMNGGLKLVEKIVADADAVNTDIMMHMAELEHPMGALTKATFLTKVDVTNGWTSEGGHDVLGGLIFVGRLPRFGTRNKGTEDSLSYYDNALKLSVERTNFKAMHVPLTANIADLDGILEGAKHWVKEVEADSGHVAELAKHSEAVRSQIDALIKKVGDGEDTAGIKKSLSAVLSINGKINSMLAMVIYKVTNHGNRQTNGLLDYAIQSCEQVHAAV